MKKVAIGLLTCAQLLVAQTDPQYAEHTFYTHYQDIRLEPTSLSGCCYKKTAPDDYDGRVSAWCSKNHALLSSLANQSLNEQATTYYEQIKPGNELLQDAGYTNNSRHNFVFPVDIEGQKYWVKIAGPNRFEQLNALLLRSWGTPFTQEDFSALTAADKTKTYQSASRMARYLLYKKWKEMNQHIPIEVPKSFLVSLSDQQLVDDAHAVIVEEHVDSLGTPNEYPEQFLANKDAVRNFIIQMSLWNINASQFLVKADGTLVFVDLEDPDNSNPEAFFNGDYAKVKSNIRCGLIELENMCNKLEQAKEIAAE